MISEVFQRDPFLVGLSFLWILFVIGVGEAARRLLHQPVDLTRKVIHIGVGAWALPTALLFQSPWWAAACPFVFVGLNAFSYRYRLMDVIEEDGRGSPGTIYFPVSFVLLIVCLWPWEGRAASVAGLYAMGFGDAAASIIGRRWGKHRFRVGRAAKSIEGSLSMLGVSFLFILLGTWPLSGGPEWSASAAAAGAAAVAEAPAGRGLDNLTVPAAAALVFFWVARMGG